VTTPDPADPPSPDERRDLARSAAGGVPAEIAAQGALAHLIEQSNREAAANRAQAREMVRALEGVQKSHEYLGTALRREQRRSRWLLASLALAPVAVVAVGWLVWRQVDAWRAEMDGRLADLTASQSAARAADTERRANVRTAEIESDLVALRNDLAVSREAIDSDRRALAEREQALAAANARGEGARSEIAGLESQVRAKEAKANAEAARAAAMERRVEELEEELAARTRPAPPPLAAAAPPAGPPGEAGDPTAPPPSAAVTAAAAAPPTPAAPAEAVERTRAVLNDLLGRSTDPVRYRVESLGGLAGRTLLDVRVVGSDAGGEVLRSIEARRADVTVDPATSSVVLRFLDGHLEVGRLRAPFFDGTYGLVLQGDAARWRASGLATVKGD
jgi:cytoskeletal protein RodZ